MINNNVNFKKQSVQTTLLLPLWGRAKYSANNNDILSDPQASNLLNKIDYDFSLIEKSLGEYGGISYIARAHQIDKTINSFIKTHPNGTIVNLGAGLDTTFSRVDNGNITWFDLDLPDVIELREHLLPTIDRCFLIGKSIFDYTWLDDIKYENTDEILFVAGGLFHFLDPYKVKELFLEISNKFKGCKLFFDICSKEGLELANQVLLKSGTVENKMLFYVNDLKDITSISNSITASEFPYYQDIYRKKQWEQQTIDFMNINDNKMMSKFVTITF